MGVHRYLPEHVGYTLWGYWVPLPEYEPYNQDWYPGYLEIYAQLNTPLQGVSTLTCLVARNEHRPLAKQEHGDQSAEGSTESSFFSTPQALTH